MLEKEEVTYKLAVKPDEATASLARFPLLNPDFVRERSEQWTVSRDLKELKSTGGSSFAGKRETGQRAAYYFLKKEGDSFVCVPVKEWVNFKPSVASSEANLTTEEVERRMKRGYSRSQQPQQQQQQVMTTPSKKLNLAAQAEAEAGLDDIDVKNVDDEKLRKQLNKTKSSLSNALDVNGRQGDGLEDEGDEQAKVGEDWEHEHSYDDDDERVEVESDPEDEKNQQTSHHHLQKKMMNAEQQAAADQDAASDGDGDGDGDPKSPSSANLSKTKKEMQKALSKFGLNDDAELLGSEDEDELEDIEDYDKMAEESLKGIDLAKLRDKRISKSSSGGSLVIKTEEEDMPSLGPSSASHPSKSKKRQQREEDATGDPAGENQQNKTSGISPEKKKKKTVQVKSETNTNANTAPSAAPQGVPTEREIETYLRTRGKMLSTELIAHFKKRLKGKEDSGKFLKVVKKVAKLEAGPGGKKFLVLKNE